MNASYLVFYPPIVIVIMLVLEICKHDDPKKIVRRAFMNFAILTGALVGASTVVFFINKYF